MLFILAIFIIGQTALACECIWQGSFNKVYLQADLVVSGKILQHKGNAADLEISHIFKGKEFLDIIRLWGDTGDLCRPNIYNFAVKSEWVLALHKITTIPDNGFNPNTPSFSFGRKGDYSVSNCGAYWLEYDHGFVTGNLINGGRWQRQDKKMSPVRIEVIDAYINGRINDSHLIEAAKPQQALRDLMNSTKQLLRP